MRIITHPEDRRHLYESYYILGGVYLMAGAAAVLLGVIVLGMVFAGL
ncbi:MAG: hypothetical protein ACNS63_07025 [Candidatus Nitrospinota bacterium M3_3B_026]